MRENFRVRASQPLARPGGPAVRAIDCYTGSSLAHRSHLDPFAPLHRPSMGPLFMNVDLPPLSAFTPDPAVARARTTRDTLTLALQAEQGPGLVRHEGMSGIVTTGASRADGPDACRMAIGPAEEAPL